MLTEVSEEDFFFNAVFQKEGGLFIPKNQLEKEIGLVLKLCRHIINTSLKVNPKLPNVHFNFIDHSKVGAKAKLVHGKYYIGIYIGSFYVIGDLFNRMLCTREILKEYGNITEENEIFQKIVNAQIIDVFHLYDVIKNPGEKLTPKNEVRQLLSLHLTVISMKHLFLHELGHIINGHLNFIKKEPKIYECLSAIDYQTLEWDADCFAVQSGVNETLHYFENKQ